VLITAAFGGRPGMMFALCKLGKFIRMVPHSVMLGFVNGLAIVIFIAQFGHFKLPGADGVAMWMSGPNWEPAYRSPPPFRAGSAACRSHALQRRCILPCEHSNNYKKLAISIKVAVI
jgi:hypothetical protein